MPPPPSFSVKKKKSESQVLSGIARVFSDRTHECRVSLSTRTVMFYLQGCDTFPGQLRG